MAKFFFFDDNIADRAVLSGGAWATTMPIQRLQDRRYKKRARSIDLLTASTQFVVTLDTTVKIEPIGVLGFHSHNASLEATMRVTASNEPDFSNPDYVTTIAMWPPIRSISDMRLEDENLITGQPTAEERASYPSFRILVLDALVYAKYWKFEVEDPNNSDGYFQMGRLFMARARTLPHDMMKYPTFQWVDPSIVDVALGGAEYYDIKEKYRLMHFTLMGTKDDITRVIGELQRRQGVSGEVVFCADPADKVNFMRDVFVGRISQLSPMQPIAQDFYSVTMNLKELL